MQERLDDMLCQHYPDIFRERHYPASESAMHWGIDCGDGWFNLIDVLCREIQREVEERQTSPVIAKQVKEKFGRLCFHYDGGNDVVEALVQMACAFSVRICEICGAPTVAPETLNFKYPKARCQNHAECRSAVQPLAS